jgi:hypothetical protein
MTTMAPSSPQLDPTLRTGTGSPRRWRSAGPFGVLFAHAFESRVVERTYEPASNTCSPMPHLRDAHAHGSAVRRVQPGVEFEVMRLEAGVWRDFMGRTVPEVEAARWRTA